MRTLSLAATLTLFAASAADLPLVQPKDLAAQLSQKAGARPVVLQIGPNLLYRNKHIPGSEYAGPAGKPEGLALLKAAVEKLPRDREIVVYCGCCPWDVCPNVRPAMELLRQMGFRRARALMIPKNFAADWIDVGYPVEAGSAAAK